MSGSAFTTPDALAIYMLTEVGPITDDVRLTVDDFALAVEDALYAYFGDDGGVITDATNTRKLRMLARIEAWQTAITWALPYVTNSTDGQSFNFDEWQIKAERRLADARFRASQAGFLTGNEIIVTTLTFAPAVDPFARATTATEFG